MKPTKSMRDRARGVLLGQFVGDALGTTVEFSDPASIKQRFPSGLRDIIGEGPFKLLPGQITDDSELALALARTLAANGLDLDARAKAYTAWIESDPFDVGGTTRAAFDNSGAHMSAEAIFSRAKERSGANSVQANGALMRVSPMAIFGASLAPEKLMERAAEDARFSHPSAVCQAANASFVRAIQVGLHGGTPEQGHAAAKSAMMHSKELSDALDDIATQPVCAGSKQGWVITAVRNAFHVLLHENSFEDALVKTVMAGGDADTNGCIAGALLGAFHGMEGIPPRWIAKVLGCRTSRGPVYQTGDAIALADELLDRGLSAPKQ